MKERIGRFLKGMREVFGNASVYLKELPTKIFRKVKEVRIYLLQWYIIKEFLVVFLISSFSLTLIAIVFNLVMDISWFTQHQDVLSSKFNYILLVYFLRGPHLYYYIAPLCVLISIAYVISSMSKNFELVAVVNAGMSLKKLFMPLILVNVILSFLYFFFLDQVVTYSLKNARYIERIQIWNDENFKATDFLVDLKEPIKGSNPNITYTYIGYVSRNGIMSNVTIQKFYDAKNLREMDFKKREFSKGLIEYTISARYGKWDEKLQNWVLYSVELLKLSPLSEIEDKKKLDKYVPPFKLDKPSYFFPSKYEFEALTLSEMKEELIKPLSVTLSFDQKNYYQKLMMIYSRPSVSVSLLIAAIIALGFVKVLSRDLAFANMIFQSVFRYVLYFVSFLGGVYLGEKAILPPVVAAWIANVIFLAYGVYLNYKLKT
jgi:lipopolysaccharide export system permease protein